MSSETETVISEVEPTAAECLRLRVAIWPGLPKFVPTPEQPQQDFFEAVAEGLRTAAAEAAGLRIDVAQLRDRVAELEAVLRKIQAWEMLNPPRVDLLPELGWLKAVVMKVNLGPTAEAPGAQPNKS